MTIPLTPIHYITPCSTSQGSVANLGPDRAAYKIGGRPTTLYVSLAGGTIHRNLKHLCATPESTSKHTSTRKVRHTKWSTGLEDCQ